MKFTPLEIPEVILIEPDVHGDARGFFTETFRVDKYATGGIDRVFVQDNFSFSRRGILRGLHLQLRQPQGKLVYVARGEIFDVAVDLRRGAASFGRWVGRTLSGENHHQLYVPEGFAHGFCVLSDEAEVMYKCTSFYAPKDEVGVVWNDPDLNIRWPVQNPKVSTRDAGLPQLRDVARDDLPA